MDGSVAAPATYPAHWPSQLDAMLPDRQVELPEEQFESIFYALLVRQLRATLSEDGLFPGESTDSYGVLFDQLMGQHLAQAQPLGIGQMLAKYRQVAAEP